MAGSLEQLQATEQLQAAGVDVVRVSYPDLIGVDRGRDVLLDQVPSAVEHGLAFCRAVYHTSPMADVVPVAGGLDQGLPDISVVPDLSTLTPLPWEPQAAWCLADAFLPDGLRRPRIPAMLPAGWRTGWQSWAMSWCGARSLSSMSASVTRTGSGSVMRTSQATSTSSAGRVIPRDSCCTCSVSYVMPGWG